MGQSLDKTKKLLESLAYKNGEHVVPIMVSSWVDDNADKFSLRDIKVCAVNNFQAISISAQSDDIILEKEKIGLFTNIANMCDEFVFSKVNDDTLKIEFIIRLVDIFGEVNEQA